MSEHTPTTRQVESRFAFHLYDRENIVVSVGRERFKAWLAAEIAAAEQRGAERTEQAIYELTEAIRLTVEYVRNDMLPPIDGWSWFDALRKYRPELAEHFEQNPQLRPDNHVVREIIAEQMEARNA